MTWSLPTGRSWEQPTADVAQAIIEGMDALRGLRGVAIHEVWATIEKIRADGGPAPAPDRRDLLEAEWRLLASYHRTPGCGLPGRATPTPEGYDRLLDQVVRSRGSGRTGRWSDSPG